MARKRKLAMEEFDVGDVKECGSAIVHGVVTDLSPVKKSKKDEKMRYFSGQLSDDKSCVRVISFEPSLRQAMNDSLSKKGSISLVGCQVRAARGGGSEIVLNSDSKVELSPKKFDGGVLVVHKDAADAIQMNDLSSLSVGQHVTVTVKVKTVEPVEKVKNRDGKELSKQDCVVGDSSACGRVVLWEQDVGRLEEGESYKLTSVSVRSYRGVSFLSVGGDCTIEGVSDIGEIAELHEDDLEDCRVVRKVVDGEIGGVLYSEEYAGCLGCSAKIQSDDGVLAECMKCGMLMKLSKCGKFLTARVSVDGLDGKKYMLTMFNDIIRKIVDGVDGADVKRKLLAAPSLRFSIDRGDVVYSVQKL